jgi:hypothetical protein
MRSRHHAREPQGSNSHVTKFRSDNDLYQWRSFVWFAIPITMMTFGLLASFEFPFRYSSAAITPAVCLGFFNQYRAWRDRRSGRRFSQYDADDLGG